MLEVPVHRGDEDPAGHEPGQHDPQRQQHHHQAGSRARVGRGFAVGLQVVPEPGTYDLVNALVRSNGALRVQVDSATQVVQRARGW